MHRTITTETNHWMHTLIVWGIAASITFTLAQEPRPASKSKPGAGWFTGAELGMSHQVPADLDGGGEFGVNRFALNTSLGYRTRTFDSVSLGIGYQQSVYDFDGNNLLTPTTPWDEVHFLSLSLPIRKQLSEDWMALAIPTIRTMTEDLGDVDQNITGGGIFGLSYQINPHLKLGPGFGILSQLEDSTSFFPVVVVDWMITDKWRFQTGRGFAASQGPGLTVSYALNPSWNLMLSGRFERFRFRMDEQGVMADGVGEDQSASVYIAAAYSINSKTLLNLFAGLNFAGELSIDDAAGNEIVERDYDETPVVGANLRLRF